MATGSKLLITRLGYRNKDIKQMKTYTGKYSKQQRKAKRMAVAVCG